MRNAIVFAFVAAWAASSAGAAEWGNLKGKFILDPKDKAPAAPKLRVDKDPAICADPANPPLLDESLVVSEKGGIANIVVAMFLKTGAKKPDVHESYADAAKKAVVIDNTKCRFEPRISIVRTGQDMILKNSDTTGHNVKGDLLVNQPFNDNLPAGSELKKVFKSEEKVPAIVSCSIHGWMKGFAVVRDDPYMTVSAKDGTFEIKNIPAGKWTFRAWQERSGYVEEVNVGGKAEKWTRGQFEVTIADKKDNDLGDIKVPLKEFPEK